MRNKFFLKLLDIPKLHVAIKPLPVILITTAFSINIVRSLASDIVNGMLVLSPSSIKLSATVQLNKMHCSTA